MLVVASYPYPFRKRSSDLGWRSPHCSANTTTLEGRYCNGYIIKHIAQIMHLQHNPIQRMIKPEGQLCASTKKTSCYPGFIGLQERPGACRGYQRISEA